VVLVLVSVLAGTARVDQRDLVGLVPGTYDDVFRLDRTAGKVPRVEIFEAGDLFPKAKVASAAGIDKFGDGEKTDQLFSKHEDRLERKYAAAKVKEIVE
jgi:hypothetical protein